MVMKVPGLLREASVVRASGGTRRPLQEKVVLQKWTKFCHGAAKKRGSAVDEASLGRKGECRQGEATYGGDLLSRNKKTGCLLESARWVEFTTGLKMEVFCGADAKEESLYPCV